MPFANSIKASVIVVFVEETVDESPLTVKSPDTVTSPNVTLLLVATA